MKVKVQKEILEKFNPCIGVLYLEEIDNSVEIEEIGELLNSVLEEVDKIFSEYKNISDHPTISAWRKAYKEFGTDPKKYRSSIEALVKRLLKGELPPRINTLVDLYNYISIKHVLPLGGEDMDSISGDLYLGLANGDESFYTIGSSENDPPKKGEVLYKDDEGAVCRRWNWREADRTKLTKNTKNAVIVVDSISSNTKEEVENALNELSELIQKYCGGEVRKEIIC